MQLVPVVNDIASNELEVVRKIERSTYFGSRNFR
jgi:hypothetical protein